MAKKNTTSGGSKSSARRRLGRGLGSLMSTPVQVEVPEEAPAAASTPATPKAITPSADAAPVAPLDPEDHAPRLVMIPADQIRPNRHQPRQQFDENALAELAESIRSAGLMQPIVARPNPDASKPGELPYELIAGERRLRASLKLGLASIPVVLRPIDDQQSAEFALVENLQREDLNPIDRALAFRRLIDDFGLTQQSLADRVGINRSNIANHLRLLDLDSTTLDALRSDLITMGHARALLAVANIKIRHALLAQCARGGLAVRSLEEKVRAIVQGDDPTPSKKDRSTATDEPPSGRDAHMADLQRRLTDHLGTRVTINSGKKRGTGKLVIEFYDLDQFEGLLQRLDFRLMD